MTAPNGSGKTTLLRTLAGLCQPLCGEVIVTGGVCYIGDELCCDREIKVRTFFKCWFSSELMEHAKELADKLRLSLNTPIGKLSRGNRQKILLILAEVKAAQKLNSVLLMDEPLAALDAVTRQQMIDLWLSASPQTLRLVITHELESIHEANSLLTVVDGRLRHVGKREDRTWLQIYHSLHS
jgi:ABC-2 type transport system ATP-binding protein/manganese/iron transport system ATP-binding protein